MNYTFKSQPVPVLLFCGATLLALIKLFLASRLDLYSDEVFYWLASTKPALAYSDLPFMTSLLVGLGSALQPGSTLAARSLFLLMGSSVPLLVYWLARPITNNTLRAQLSAGLSLCIPLGGFLGLLAVPDVPLLFFGLLSTGFFERALRTNLPRYWLATGLFVALGLCTHYRFLLYPAAALLFLLIFKTERKQWLNPWFWFACSMASVGLVPVIWFNLSHQLASASFYLVERHPWSFQASGLLHVFKQAGLVTPPLYFLFGVTSWHMFKLARSGNRSAALLLSIALVNLLVYLLLAPWTDSSSTSVHWPLSGYFPLLVYTPAALEGTARWAKNHWNPALAGFLIKSIPGLGYCGSLLALAAIGSQAFQTPLQILTGSGVLSNKMAGWSEFSSHTGTVLERNFYNQAPLIVTDNYYTAAQLMFWGVSRQTWTLDNDKSRRDGRRVQLELWGMIVSDLPDHDGQPVLFITEDSTLTVPDKEIAIGAMCRQVADLNYLSTLSLYAGDKQFSFYKAKSFVTDDKSSALASNQCPFPARAWIEPPVSGAVLSGIAHIEGWAYEEDIGIDSVHLLLDGIEVAQLNYGITRPDVVRVMEVDSDPNAPDLGFDYELDTRSLANGRYTLAIRLTDNRGVVSTYGDRPVSVSN